MERSITCSFSSTTDTMALCIPSLQAISCIRAVNVVFGLETAEVDMPDKGTPRVSVAFAELLEGRLYNLLTSRRRFSSDEREAIGTVL